MITFCILLALAIVVAYIALVCGAGLFMVFGDLLICGFIIYGFVKLFKLFKKKK